VLDLTREAKFVSQDDAVFSVASAGERRGAPGRWGAADEFRERDHAVVEPARVQWGGVRLRRESLEFVVFRALIAASTPFASTNDARISGIEGAPNSRTMAAEQQQQLRVVASYSDGRNVDVTRLAQFLSN
jgi:hypothetical protein